MNMTKKYNKYYSRINMRCITILAERKTEELHYYKCTLKLNNIFFVVDEAVNWVMHSE